ncbi:NfeD family protein [uncultured Limnohabitans sp.]|jgi:membrane protein implicated in regulation of membrane protease activity|uniref:NfeD family protein n=1 Tax=uncultured Limnohabitans sp. TaxID=768543 RepID=UPI001B491F70|nr:NfeD family protein [uncultured Limnohabitans sp.]MBP6244023.1 NfeD family protein [Limnohabitans sp.]
MNNPTIWWLVAGALVALELTTGTFYLLMLALGAAAGAVVAHAGAGFTVQVVVAAAVGGLAVVVWNAYRQRQTEPPAARETAQHLDVGETVQVDAWDAQGLAQVKHRGANWTAVNTPPSKPSPGLHRIQAIQGNRLVLEKI